MQPAFQPPHLEQLTLLGSLLERPFHQSLRGFTSHVQSHQVLHFAGAWETTAN
jgi:hypothetical protein